MWSIATQSVAIGRRKIGNLIGQVIKGVGGEYLVKSAEGEIALCLGRGKLRRGGEIYIGDYVEFSLYNNGKGAIEKVLPRKNNLLRPYISNIDAIIIVIAEVPKPDFTLVDKLLIHCLREEIEPILCLNKSDIATSETVEKLKNDYNGLADIVLVSAFTGKGMGDLIKLIEGKFVCFSGQSAVGKSSLINRIADNQMLAVGEMSQKIERGKHCTRHIEIFEIDGGIKVADTCGFSVLELPMIDPHELPSYFTDFDIFVDSCKFRGCTHTNEPNCAVKKAVDNGEITKERYDRYVELLKMCQEQWRKRYE